MKLSLINQWRDVVLHSGLHNDIDLLNIHVEFGRKYLGFYFIVGGLGVEIVLKDNNGY